MLLLFLSLLWNCDALILELLMKFFELDLHECDLRTVLPLRTFEKSSEFYLDIYDAFKRPFYDS